MYPFMTLPVHSDTVIPINPYYSPVLPPVVLHIPADLPFHQPTGSLSFFHLTLHAHLSVNSSAVQHTDIPTRKWMYLLILMIYFWLIKMTFLPTRLIVWMSIDTSSQKLYLFIFIHPYRKEIASRWTGNLGFYAQSTRTVISGWMTTKTQLPDS